jgi:fumarylacetoacetate (FAA) hydrolase
MKLATRENGTRDGELVVFSSDGCRWTTGEGIPATLQQALDNWSSAEPVLRDVSSRLDRNEMSGETNQIAFAAPLPRAFQWIDGSGYLSHMELVRRARGAPMPEDAGGEPYVYQGSSDDMLGANMALSNCDAGWGIDFEAEIAVIIDDVPMGVRYEDAHQYIRLITMVNDWSLRNIIPGELKKGFGFFQGKPATTFAPFVITPEDCPYWSRGVLSATVKIDINDELFGTLRTEDDLSFDFGRMIAHAARTRRMKAGSIVGGGTIANRDRTRGHACIAEKRAVEMIDSGAPATPFLSIGDRIRIEASGDDETSLFGAIDCQVL